MKKTLLILGFSIIAALLAASAFAGSAVVIRGEVPFAFYVENQLLPAGEYQFEMGAVGGATASTVTVRAGTGSVVAFVATKPGTDQPAIVSQLSFNRYGGKYFLSGVESVGNKADLKTTKHERELMSRLGQNEQVALFLPMR